MNIFAKQNIAEAYDAYYQTEFGKKVDEIEIKLVAGLLEHVSSTSIIELGCGTGHWTEFFISKGFSVKGIDNAEAMLNIARAKNINADFLLADSTNLPFETGSQPMVSAITMVEFVDDQDQVAKEIYRILAPGGWLLLGSLNKESVLGKNQAQDEVFQHADMLDAEALHQLFDPLQVVAQSNGIYLNDRFDILDGSPSASDFEPVFIATLFQKT
jgi:ubiquinone/menaquinone biosynthesis C-methylase UbiE